MRGRGPTVKQSLSGLVALVAASAVVLAGCQSGKSLGQAAPTATSTQQKEKPSGKGSEKAAPARVETKPKARIAFNLADKAQKVRLDKALKVTAGGGMLTGVSLTGKGGSRLDGAFDASKTTWTASPRLAPGTTYQLRAEAVNSDGAKTTTSQTFRTLEPEKTLGTDISPLNGSTVGVGMPLIVQFTHDIKDKAAVERRLSVQTSKPVEGAWHWFGDSEVHYRPKVYWPSGTKVTLKLDMLGVNSGWGAWGVKNKTRTYTIGRSVITKVNLFSHHAKVYLDGRLARTIPVTGGMAGHRTRDGIKVVMGKETNKHFTNEMIDIPDSTEDYSLYSKYAMRVSGTGEYLHTASWSTWAQGKRNVSHGCVGMNTANSGWLYKRSKVGDVVEVESSGSKFPAYGNGYGDWNMSWSKWKAGSALNP